MATPGDIGLSSTPNQGYNAPAAMGIAERFVENCKDYILPNFTHRRTAQLDSLNKADDVTAIEIYGPFRRQATPRC